MVWLTLGAGFVAGIVLLALVSLSVLGRLRLLRLAAARLQARQAEVLAVQEKLRGLESAIEIIQSRVDALATSRNQAL